MTATNTLTGKKYTTATDVDGVYTMKIPRNGRYVVRAELTGFAATTQEVVLSGAEAQAATQGITIVPHNTDFGMELASRAAAAEAKQELANATGATRGTQALGLNGNDLDASDASAGTGNTGTAMPSLGNLNEAAANPAATEDTIAVNGRSGETNGLANFSEDEIRQRIQDAVERERGNGMLPPGADPTQVAAGVVGMMMGGGGPGGPGGGGSGRGGFRGGRGGGFSGGSGAFRNFNPAQPHGSIFYQAGNNALNSAPWSPSLTPVAQPAGYSNRFGLSIAGSPYIPGVIKPDTRQFVFLNLTGQKNLNSFISTGRVPTAAERAGDFSVSTVNGRAVTLYDPRTGQLVPNDCLVTTCGANAGAGYAISPQALAIINAYYPLPNIATNAQGYNYQTVSNAGSNNVSINSRYVRTIGQATNTPFGRFGGGGGRRSGGSNAPPTLRQNINIGYNYSHSASDLRKIFLPLGGASESDGNGLSLGYTIGYGRVSNSATVSWNRYNSETRNYFTNTSNNPTANVGLTVPNRTGGFANPNFYNGLPNFTITGYTGISNTTPSQIINQTMSYSDFVSWRRHHHNFRFGIDVRRVHADSIGGNNPLGSYDFSGYVTSNPADQVAGTGGQFSGNGFADFLLGLPQSTSLEAGLYKTYLRENALDWYVLDDWRMGSNFTLNGGLRYEYFGPYGEKNGHLVNLVKGSGAQPFVAVTPGNGQTAGLVHADHAMYSPRFGFAYRLPNKGLTKETVLRGGYGINYNTGQPAQFARNLSHQPPFAATQSNVASTPTAASPNTAAPSGCTTTQVAVPGVRPATTANMTLGNSGFNCSTNYTLQNNWAVDPNYRLGMVQVYNLNLQKTLGLGIVLNVGYNGSKGSNLDVVGSPNATPTGVTTASIAPFDYEESTAWSHSNQLVVSAQKRQQKGIALGATYTYQHAIDNASGVGGAIGTPVQNLYDLAAEEGNSSFDRRHELTGNWLLELPFGPNRAYLNKGGFWSHALDGFTMSGTFTFASGNYFTPIYTGSQVEAAVGNTITLRPNRVAGQAITGPRTIKQWFNTAAFAVPGTTYGTASPGSIEGPGTVSVNASLARIVPLGESRSFETRVTATNVFNTVQYSGINVTVNSNNYGQVTSAAAMRTLLVQARYRF